MSYNASSWYDATTLPRFAQLYPEKSSYWKPIGPSENEYLQINLARPEVIYGAAVAGNPKNDEFVTSYKVAYSMDGISFSYVSFHGQPEVIFTSCLNSKETNEYYFIHNVFIFVQIFRGPHSHDKTETQMFFTPIEAVYVRLIPSTWHNNIAIRVALLGCPVLVTTLSNEMYSTINPTIKRNRVFNL